VGLRQPDLGADLAPLDRPFDGAAGGRDGGPALGARVVDAAPFDDPRLQGRLAVETAVRAIEGSIERRQIGPEIRLAEPLALPPADALSPPQARPEFVVP